MSVLEMVEDLTGLNDAAERLLEILQKLPSLKGLQDAAKPSQSASLISLTSLETLGSEKQNPLFKDDITPDLAAEILARFEKSYAKTKKTGIVEIDEIRKQAFYLKFIAQECAERSAAGQPLDGEVFSLEDWRIFSQEVFHDTGNNITFPLTTGKRKDGKMGAGSGGLGDKITKLEFEEIVAKLKDEKISDEARNQLRDILIRADNVEYLANGSAVEFLNENIDDHKAKIRAITLARETCEELFEPYVQALLLDPKTDFVALIEKAFGRGKIEGVGRLMLQQIQNKVALIVENNKRLPVEGDAEYEKKLSSKLTEIYKDEIEPYFVRFLKVSSQGQALIAEMQGAIDAAQSTNYRVNDLSFPQRRLEAVESGAAFADEKRPSISIPQSNSLVIDPTSCPILLNLSAQTRDFIAKNPKTIANPIEYKGANYFENPADHLKFLLEIYTGEDAKNQPSLMAYAHEIFAQIRAAMLPMKASEIAEVFNQVREADDKFDEKFTRRNEWLANAKLTNLHTNKVSQNVQDVALEMFAGRQEVLKAALPAQFATKKDRVTCVVIVDSSCAFEVAGNPLGASEEKAVPYKEKVGEFLRAAKENNVDRYVLTTDKHPEGHHNFLKNLLKDDNFFAVYKEYLIGVLEKNQNPAKLKEAQTMFDQAEFGFDGEGTQEIIAALDSMAPFGVEVGMPQILQTISQEGKIETVGVKIGDLAYKAQYGDSSNGIIITDTNPVDLASLSFGAQVVTQVSAWPSHSYDQTMYYSGAIIKNFEESFPIGAQLADEEFGFGDFNAESLVNKMIEISIAENGEPVSSESYTINELGVVISVSCKGQNPQIENYSPFFNEALGINQKAMVEEVQALFELSKDAKCLTIPLVGIAYDFCVKNRALDTINFIAPALQALQLMHKSKTPVTPEKVAEVVSNISKIVDERIKSGNADIKAGVSIDAALGEYSFAMDNLLKIQVVIPRGATIEIGGQDKARDEMCSAAKKQVEVIFAEPEIEQVFNNTKSLSSRGEAGVQASQLQKGDVQGKIASPAH